MHGWGSATDTTVNGTAASSWIKAPASNGAFHDVDFMTEILFEMQFENDKERTWLFQWRRFHGVGNREGAVHKRRPQKFGDF